MATYTEQIPGKSRIKAAENGRGPFRAPSETPIAFGAAAKSVEYADRLRAHYREARRVPVEIPCTVEVVLADGAIYDSGTAMLKNISPSGALLTAFSMASGNLPVALFKLRLVLKGDPYAGIGIEATPIRFAGGTYGIGVKFDEIFVAV
ncbi:MAG TPA: PilZ domain-containing protein [Planctomycetota bacterium]|nr:PilZ domain-containing protein [Planctomycetota bacterium]